MPRLAIALGALFVTRVASAQALDDYRPAIDSRGYLTLNGSEVLDHTDMSFGLGSLQWGRHLLQFENGDAFYSVDNMVSATLIAAFGLHLGIPLEVGASLPFTIMNGSRGPDALGDPNDPNDDKLYQLDGQGVGDFGVHLKARLAQVGPFGFGALASVYVPTGSSRDPFMGEATATPQLMGLVDATFGRLRLALNGGIRIRRTTTFMDMGEGGAPATMGSITTSSALPVGFAVAYGVIPEKVELVGEVFGAIPLGEHKGYQPLEALGGVKLYLAKNSYLSLGAGRGLLPDQAGNPDFRAVVGIVFEPKPAQRASGHVPQEIVAEVTPTPDDGLRDRDNDGIVDRDDKCPDDMEDYDGVDDEDGCPEQGRSRVVTGRSEIITLQPIEFEFDKDVLRDSAYPILDDIVKAIKDNNIMLLEVQGHTDEQGNDAYNLDLSKRRAATVMRYLREHGIDSTRLLSEGYGETMPLDNRHTQEAYTKNRRVAFKILQRD